MYLAQEGRATFAERAYWIAMTDLFPDDVRDDLVTQPSAAAPLAERLRPRALDEVVGQEHLTGPEGALGRMVAAGKLSSLVLWGPPGTGKTSIARLLADAVGLRFVAGPTGSATTICPPRPSARARRRGR